MVRKIMKGGKRKAVKREEIRADLITNQTIKHLEEVDKNEKTGWSQRVKVMPAF